MQNGRAPIQTLVEGEKHKGYAQELFTIAEQYWLEINSKTRKSLEKDGVMNTFMEQNISRLNKNLKEKLGAELASLCKLTVIKAERASGYALPSNLDIVIR